MEILTKQQGIRTKIENWMFYKVRHSWRCWYWDIQCRGRWMHGEIFASAAVSEMQRTGWNFLYFCILTSMLTVYCIVMFKCNSTGFKTAAVKNLKVIFSRLSMWNADFFSYSPLRPYRSRDCRPAARRHSMKMFVAGSAAHHILPLFKLDNIAMEQRAVWPNIHHLN